MAGARGFRFAPADPDPGGADPAGVRFWPGSGLKFLAGVRPRPGSGSKILAGVKPRPGSGSKNLAGVIAPVGVSRGHYPDRNQTLPGSGSAGAKPRAPAITADFFFLIVCSLVVVL